MNLWAVFLTGLTVGGLSCLAVQGGLLASTIAARAKESLTDKQRHSAFWPVAAFLVAKLLAYTILGFVLGLIGEQLAFSDKVREVMQLVVGVYMILIALDLLNVHPFFRFFVLQPPRFLTKLIHNQSKSSDIFAPAVLGFMTIFIPCGTTLAMELYAISSGSPWMGAAILATFILGTSPLFFAIGYLTASLSEAFQQLFLKTAALLIIFLAILAINGSLLLWNSPVTLQKLYQLIPIEINLNGPDGASLPPIIDGQQVVDIDVQANGYKPDHIQVKAGIPVQLNLTTMGGLGCTSVFKLPELSISQELPDVGSKSIAFTAHNPGIYTWTCSMGIYTGTLEVI